MLVGGAIALAGVAFTAYTLLATPDEGVNIGGGFAVVVGVLLLAVGGAMRSE